MKSGFLQVCKEDYEAELIHCQRAVSARGPEYETVIGYDRHAREPRVMKLLTGSDVQYFVWHVQPH